jgi:hypothetical protein
VNRLLVVLLLLFGCIEFANAEKLTSEEYKKKQYEDLKKGDWVKISLNYEWNKRQLRNWARSVGGIPGTHQAPKACGFKAIWGSVHYKTKDLLTLQTYYSLSHEKKSGVINNIPGPHGIEKQAIKNIQIKPTEIQSITPWNDNEDPELPLAGRK